MLNDVKFLNDSIKIKVAKSGQYMQAKKCGSIKVKSIFYDKSYNITINNELHVPNLQYNLLSVRKLEMNGHKIVFENGQAKIMSNS